MSWGLAALSGLLGGLQGLPKGMAQGTEFDQRQQQIDELKRSRMATEANQTTDLSQLSQMLGIQLPGVQPGTRVPTNTANLVVGKKLGDQAKAEERAGTEAAIAGIPEQYRPFARIKDGASLAKLIYGQETQKPQIVGENARGYLKGDQFTPFPESPETAIPPGMEPSSVTRRGVTYKPPGADRPPRTLAERVAAGRAAFAADPSPENRAALGRLEEALKVETGLAGARAGATASARQEVEPQELLSPEEAAALGVPYGTRKGQAQGRTSLTAGQRTKMDAQSSVLAMVDKMERDVKAIATPPTSPGGRVASTPKALYDVYGQGDPKLSALHSRIEASLALIVRALGEVGTLTDGDIQRARALQPVFAPIPDTADVVREKLKGLRELVQEVAARTGSRPENMGQPGAAPAAGPKQIRIRDPKTGRTGSMTLQPGEQVPAGLEVIR